MLCSLTCILAYIHTLHVGRVSIPCLSIKYFMADPMGREIDREIDKGKRLRNLLFLMLCSGYSAV